MIRILLALTLSILVSSFARAEPLTVQDYRGNVVTFPNGAKSFADKVLFTRIGRPPPRELRQPRSALGRPDWNVPDTQRSNFPDLAYSVGCRGSLAVQFVDNALINVPGDDLFIFEVGANIEGSRVFVSNDGQSWEPVGQIGGAFASVDLARWPLRSSSYRYVLIEDQGQICDPLTPGIDIDAIGAIGSAERFTLDGEVLFDTDQSTLRPEAQAFLEKLVRLLHGRPLKRIEIVGHTDSVGTASYNHNLGRERAIAVADYIARRLPELRPKIAVFSRGEQEPVARNDTDFTRQKNRRVEMIVFD